MSRRDVLLAGLQSDDLLARAAAIDEIGMLSLGHPPILEAMVDLSADPTPLPASIQPPSDDPFASFFGSEPPKRTFGQHATERIFRAGLPGHHLTVEALHDLLVKRRDPAVCATLARLFSETRWEDPEHAAKRLIPALHARDVSLAPTIASADPTLLALLVESALSPYRSRAVNELMNAPAARSQMIQALRDALPELPEARLAEALAVLVSWRACEAVDLQPLESEHPWVARFTALLDPSAAARAAAIPPTLGPPDLDRRLDEAQA